MAVVAPQTAVDAALTRDAQGGGASMAASTQASTQVVMTTTPPLSYTVKPGDTLWDIASMYLRDPWLWPEIWHVNPAVQNPHLIYPGDVLTLAYGADGSPQVTLARGDAVRVQPMMRSTELEGGAIPTIPYASIAAFLGKPGIVSSEELNGAPRVGAVRDNHIVAAAGHQLYVKNMRDNAPGRYNILRVGDQLKDPDDGAVLGYLGVYAGVVQIDAVDELSKALVLDSAREMAPGDVLVAEDTNVIAADFLPRAPDSQVDGRIMAVVDGVSQIGEYQVVAMNRGANHGLEVGHVLAIDREGPVVRDGSCRRSGLALCRGTLKLPNERAGSVLVFKIYDGMSYGLILQVTEPVHVADRVYTP